MNRQRELEREGEIEGESYKILRVELGYNNNCITNLFDYSVASGYFKLSCDCRFQRAFTTCVCVFNVNTLVGSNQRNYFENATACSERKLKIRALRSVVIVSL